MTARAPVVLLVVAALLFAYILAFERGRPSRAELESRSGMLLDTVLRERITRLRIESGQHLVVVRRDGEGFDERWTLEEPERGPGDPEAVEDYLRNWEFAVPTRRLTSPTPEDVERFGFGEPRAEVTFEMARTVVPVRLGSGTPVEGGGYVRVGHDESVLVVGKHVVELFDPQAHGFALDGDTDQPTLSDLEAEQKQDGGADAVQPAQ